MSHKVMVGASSQLPCGGHLAGWGHGSGKARKMLELPEQPFLPPVGIALFMASDTPYFPVVLWGCTQD